jgi:hypothetical protein
MTNELPKKILRRAFVKTFLRRLLAPASIAGLVYGAVAMVQNYFQALFPKISIARLFGEFLEKFTIHHQLLSASYTVGDPSAGYALALNTMEEIFKKQPPNGQPFKGALRDLFKGRKKHLPQTEEASV